MSIGKNLSEMMKRILTRTSVDAEDVDALIKNLQKILIHSDVDIQLIYDLSKNIREKCLKGELPVGLTLREHVMKTVYDELVSLLGEKQESLASKKRIMLVGLFGSGKTSTAAKIAKYFQKQGLKPAMIACDYHRPAASEQLKQLGDKMHIPVHSSKEKDTHQALVDGLNKFQKYDVVLIDTAGRDALDKDLAKELTKMHKLAKPDETLLIIPADIGRIAGKQAEEFHKLVGVTGVIVTKMDGTAKGGGAISACSKTKAKVKFITTGENLENIEPYDPVRYVSRLLGLGDLQTLLEKAKEAEFNEENAEKLMSGKFTLKEFYNQISGVQKMGSLDSVVNMIPGLGNAVPEDLLKAQEENLKKYKYIMDSMTKEERENADLIHASRVKRIAKGSGCSEKDVRNLIKQYEQSKKMIKKIGGMKGMKRGMMKKMAKKMGIKM